MPFPIPCIAAATSQSGRGGAALSNDTSLSTFTVNGVTVASGGNTQHNNGTTAVEVQIRPTDTNVTSMVALASGAFPGNANQWPTVGFDPVVFDFDNMAVGNNTLTIRVVAEDGVTTQDHEVTVRRLTAGVVEITRVDFSGLSLGGANFATAGAGLGVIASNVSARIGFWGGTGTESQPDWSSDGVTQYVEIAFSDTAVKSDCAIAFSNAFAANGFTCAAAITDGFDATCVDVGARVDAVHYIGSVTVTQQGEDPS